MPLGMTALQHAGRSQPAIDEREREHDGHREHLLAEQSPAAAEEHAVLAGRVDRRVGEQPEQDRADDPADEVHRDHVERVVVAELELQADREEAHRARDRHRSRSGAMPPTKPAHGVIATSPATAPDAAPSVVACPPLIRSTISQPSIAAAAATNVFMNACAATPLAASAEPALKPNQPNHRMPVPSNVSGSECGGIGSRRPTPPLAEDQHQRERGRTRVDVHDGAAREVERTPLGEPAAREHPVRDRAGTRGSTTAR